MIDLDRLAALAGVSAKHTAVVKQAEKEAYKALVGLEVKHLSGVFKNRLGAIQGVSLNPVWTDGSAQVTVFAPPYRIRGATQVGELLNCHDSRTYWSIEHFEVYDRLGKGVERCETCGYADRHFWDCTTRNLNTEANEGVPRV